MTPDRDSRLAPSNPADDGFEDEEAPRSIFSATWFRVVLVVVGVAIIGAVSVPYVLDVVNPPPAPVAQAPPRAVPSPATGTTAPSTPAGGGAAQPSASASSPAPAPAPMTSAPTSAKENDATSKTSPAASRSERALVTSAVKDPSGERVAQTPSAPARTSAAEAKESKESKAAEGGDYFVQVGAFKDQETARRMAASLRAQNYPVTESMKRLGDAMAADTPRPTPRAPVASAGVDRYDVIVTGGSTADINTKLAAKGLAAESATDGVRIRPSLPLRDAVALSKDLNNDGFKVQVRRGGAETATAAAVRTPTATDGDGGGATLYRVRVGGFPDRATAQSALRALKGKGYDPFIAKGRE